MFRRHATAAGADPGRQTEGAGGHHSEALLAPARLPTVADAGYPGFALAWNGILVTAGTLRPIITRLNTEIVPFRILQ
jgi:tripartite-type tricarboxylate transporter receptor subunit TctC